MSKGPTHRCRRRVTTTKPNPVTKMSSRRSHLCGRRHLAAAAVLAAACAAEVAAAAADFCDPAAICRGGDGGGGSDEGYGGCLSPRLGACREKCLSEEFPVFVPINFWVCNNKCIPLNLACDGVCDIRPYLRQQGQRRAKQIRLLNAGRAEARFSERTNSIVSSSLSAPIGRKAALASSDADSQFGLKPVHCFLNQYYELELPFREASDLVGQVCLSPGMACNDTCGIWWQDDQRGRSIRLHDAFLGETICVPFCDRETEWQCGERGCQDKEEPCNGKCPKDYFLCRNENRCIPLRWACDGSANLGCQDRADEAVELCGDCADGMRQCGDKILCKTEQPELICDGQCQIGYEKCDERTCVTHRQSCNGTCLRPGMLPCGHQCYNLEERCDGKNDCADGTDERECGRCQNGSKRCGERIICVEDFCPLDPANADKKDDDVEDEEQVTEEECSKMCDRFWCKKEQRCLSRNNQLQGCSDLSGYHSVDLAIFANVSGPNCDAGVWEGSTEGRGQIFKQASCVPDKFGHCPTSLLIESSVVPHPDDLKKISGVLGPELGEGGLIDLSKVDLSRASGVVKVWFKCGQACWRKDVNFGPGELPERYYPQKKTVENKLELTPKCNREEFPDLCLGRCLFYDAWFCDGHMICTDRPCHARCPTKAGPKGEKFYLCSADARCVPETVPCRNRCPEGRFRCGNRCLSPNKVCDGVSDCSNREDENPEFCGGCAVGQRMCDNKNNTNNNNGGRPLCLDQKCNGECYHDEESDLRYVDCGFEGERNICAERASQCDKWMEKRYGRRII